MKCPERSEGAEHRRSPAGPSREETKNNKPLGSELDFEHLYAITPKGGRECWEMQNQSLRSRIAAGTPAGFALPDDCRLTPVSLFSHLCTPTGVASTPVGNTRKDFGLAESSDQ